MFFDGLSWAGTFPEGVTEIAKDVQNLHNDIFIVMSIVAGVVFSILLYICIKFKYQGEDSKVSDFNHSTKLEVFWVMVPVAILIFINILSIPLALKQFEILKSDVVVKVVGHQWYWEYEYPDHKIAPYTSIMVEKKDLKKDEQYLLSVDNPMVVPVGAVIKLQITSADVVHSWAVPGFAMKRDAVPGRLHETWFKAEKEGIFFGQCSELCGMKHGFMPIEVRVVDQKSFDKWVKKMKS